MISGSQRFRNQLFWRLLVNRIEFVNSASQFATRQRAFSSARPRPDDHHDEEVIFRVPQTPVVRKKTAARSSVPHLAVIEPELETSLSSPFVSTGNPDADSDPFESKSPMTLKFIDRECPIISKLHLVTPEEDVPRGVWPVFRLMVRKELILQSNTYYAMLVILLLLSLFNLG
jgi:hypothetical protein